MFVIQSHPCLREIDRTLWQRLSRSDYPFLAYDFLEALESSGVVSQASGWQPHHLTLSQRGEIQAIIPCYLKSHSRGEYVFDWSWANACERMGLDYYPKLLCAIPFTPSSGPRWLSRSPLPLATVMAVLQQESERLGLLSWHLLFPDADSGAPQSHSWLERNDCQFHWRNRDYGTLDDFLARLTASKRKTIRRERRKVSDQGVVMERIDGPQISLEQLEIFYGFYRQTYQLRGQTPYLNRAFFRQLLAGLSQHLMLVSAQRDGQPCGTALFLHDQSTLYGRWWGGDPGIDCLHFEACYYQGIEFAIERGLSRFDPGTQGEHKLIRGFEPVLTRSFHHLNDPRLQSALQRWTAEERHAISQYQQGARRVLPFNRQHKSLSPTAE